MVDGTRIHYEIEDFDLWRKNTGIELCTLVNVESGCMPQSSRLANDSWVNTITYKGSFGSYKLRIKEVMKNDYNGQNSIRYFLTIDGSLHSNHHRGCNFEPFTCSALCSQIKYLCKGLCIQPEKAIIVNLETGLNIPLPFDAYSFLENSLISYKGHSFDRYKPDRGGRCLGYVCYLSQYSVKVYDKSLQYNLPYPLLRFELSYNKMQQLRGLQINTLSDIMDKRKVFRLTEIAVKAWNNIFIYDCSIDPLIDRLKESEKRLLQDGNNPRYWEILKKKSKRQFNHERERMRALSEKYGRGYHKIISELMSENIKNLFICTNLPLG